MTKLTLLFSVSFLTIGFFTIASAQDQYNAAWFDISADGSIFPRYKIDYLGEAQLRTLNKGGYEMNFLQTAIGYRPRSGLSYWLGYQWNSFNPAFNAERENRVFEQLVWEVFKGDFLTFRTRTRFEQRSRMHNPQWSNRLREKMTLYFPKIANRFTPLLFNEIFFNLNSTPWATTKAPEQNRAFAGVDITLSKNIFLEAGYLQQNVFGQQDRLNHVLFVSLNINAADLALPDYVR